MKRVDIAKNWAGTGVAVVCLLGPAIGQDAAEKPEETAEETPKVEVEAGENEENTKAEETATPEQSDTDVLAQAPQMEIEQLQEMVQVYRRLGNTEMAESLSKVLLSKDPDNAIAKAGGAEGAGDEPTGDGVPQVSTPSAADRELTRAENAVAAGRHDEAVKILRGLKAAEFSGVSFPHQQDLAYALLESGQVAAAADAFRELVNDRSQSRADRADAEARLIEIRVQLESKRAMLLLSANKNDEAIALAAGLLAIYPNNPPVVSLNADVLSKSERHPEAVALLKDLKSKSGPGKFDYQQQLAYAVFESEGRAASEPFFRELSSKRYPVEQRRDALERLRDFQIERLYERGMKAINNGDAASGLRLGNRLMQANPIPNVGYELRALALKAQRRFAEAAKVLEQYKSIRFRDKPFPMTGELADCYAGTGDFIKARHAYDEILNAPAITEGTDLKYVKLARQQLAPITDPYISADSEFFTEEEGDMFRAEIEARTGMFGPHQFAIRAHRDDIDLEESFLKDGSYDRWDASATYTATLPNRYYADITGGGSEDEFLYGIGVGRRPWGGIGWKLYFAGNERATDSLTLEALDGRQDAVHFDVSGPFGKSWYFDGRFNYRQVDVDGVEIGDGLRADVHIGKTLRESSLTNTGFYVGYNGEFSDFSHSSLNASDLRRLTGINDPLAALEDDIADSLVEERINRHSIELIVQRQITPRIAAAVIGGFGWEFEDEEFVYRAGLNLNYKLRDNVSIQAAVDYDSSGSGTNSGSEVIFASVLLRIFF